MDFRPKMIISGGSAYPREWDYKRLRAIANKVGSLLMTDMAHIRCVRIVVLASLLESAGSQFYES